MRLADNPSAAISEIHLWTSENRSLLSRAEPSAGRIRAVIRLA
jgi:hypothetical protein